MDSYKLLPVAGEWVLSKNGKGEVRRFKDKAEALKAAIRLAREDGASLVLDPPPRGPRSPSREE